MGPIVFESSLSQEDKQNPAVELFEPLEGMIQSSQNLYSLGAGGYHWVNKLLLNMFAPILTYNLELSYAEIKEVEKQVFEDPAWEEVFRDSVAECYRQGVSGLIQDLQACAMPFGFSLSKLSTKTRIFVGADDQFTPPGHAKLLKELIPNCELHIISNHGHWSLYSHFFAQILSQIATDRII